MKTFFDEIGINIMQSIAGLFGSLLLVGKGAAKNLKQTFFAIITGVASANYLTPVVCDVLRISDTNYSNGVAFILGFLGLKGVEAISKKILKR
jgi:hypothetical protein